ncbi:electron transfer flavoprotein subunit beta/FixA family protein [Caballeronia sp. 15715]|uniref:electron transfer flavoprotein subunit beta/FixA family protein n=1 Tax=Caballeronia sp. 15715 TaxID=3391030 RepID=UPI0039E53DA4
MKILVAVKRVVDPNVNVRVNSDHSGVDIANLKMAINPFDEVAVEQAVRLKECGQATEVVVVSIGSDKVVETLRTALAIGADRAVHILTDVSVEPLAVAKLLQAVVRKEEPTLVLLGKQAIDDDSNQTGQMLAGLLEWPQATFVSSLVIEGEELHITREVDAGTQELVLQMPAVATVDLRLNDPRHASLPNIMKAKKKLLDAISAESLGVDVTPRLTIIEVRPPIQRQAGKKVATVQELKAAMQNAMEAR